MTDAPNSGPEDKEPAEGSRETVDAALADHEAGGPTPVAPGPLAAAPSASGVVAGDADELDEARDDGRD